MCDDKDDLLKVLKSQKEQSKKRCKKCGKLKYLTEFRIIHKQVSNPTKDDYRSECMLCEEEYRKKQVEIKKNAPPKPAHNRCIVCFNKPDNVLVCEHDHKADKFRGWICNECNVALGQLGDDAEGVARALAYIKGEELEFPDEFKDENGEVI